MNTVYLNQRFVPLDKAKISILDRGFLYGDGVFETMRAYKGVVFLLEKHIERLFRSLRWLHMPIKMNKSKMREIVYKLLDKNGLEDAYIKIIITRGISKDLLMPSGKEEPTVAIYTLPYKAILESIYRKGIRVSFSSSRYNENSKIAGQKTLNYLDNILCRYDSERKGFNDVMLINTKGFVSEASSSNIFLVKRKKLFTPSLKSGCLPGITRKEVMRLAKRFLKYKVIETFVTKDALYRADEVFLTNSLVEVIPVIRIDNHIVGRGKPGLITNKLRGLYQNSVNSYRRGIFDKNIFL